MLYALVVLAGYLARFALVLLEIRRAPLIDNPVVRLPNRKRMGGDGASLCEGWYAGAAQGWQVFSKQKVGV